MREDNNIQTMGSTGDKEEIFSTSEEGNATFGVSKTQLLDISAIKNKPKANPRRRKPKRKPKTTDMPVLNLRPSFDNPDGDVMSIHKNDQMENDAAAAPIKGKIRFGTNESTSVETEKSVPEDTLIVGDSTSSTSEISAPNVEKTVKIEDEFDSIMPACSNEGKKEKNNLNGSSIKKDEKLNMKIDCSTPHKADNNSVAPSGGESAVNPDTSLETTQNDNKNTKASPRMPPKFGGVPMFGGMGADLSAAIKARNKRMNKDTGCKDEDAPKIPSSKKPDGDITDGANIEVLHSVDKCVNSELESRLKEETSKDYSTTLDPDLIPNNIVKDEIMSGSTDSNEILGTIPPPMPEKIESSNKLLDPLFGSPGESNSQDEYNSDDLFSIQ